MAVILTFDEAGEVLDTLADAIPQPLLEGLNGGINLQEEAMPDPEFPDGEIYIMGEYCEDMLGRYINLYYGSFAALAAKENWFRSTWERELKKTLSHELTHHMEGRAGTDSLDRRDAAQMEELRREYGGGDSNGE